MNKPKPIDAIAVLTAGALATRIGIDLAHHNVSIATTIAAATAMFSAVLWVFSEALKARRTRVYRCPNCPVTITATNASDAERQRLRDLAADHARHGVPAGE